MDKDTLDILIKMAVAIVAIWTLFYKRTEILGITHKDYTAKLDSTVRFFHDFFNKTNQSKLVLDRAAQELVRSDYVDNEFVLYLIKLHEARIISFDEIIRLYKLGRKSINYKLQDKVTSDCFEIKIKKGRSVKRQTFIWGLQYVFFAFIFLIPLIFSNLIVNKFFNFNAPIFLYILIIIYFFGTFILAITALIQTANIQDAETFINKLKVADEKYVEHEKNEKEKLKTSDVVVVQNIREYNRNRY